MDMKTRQYLCGMTGGPEESGLPIDPNAPLEAQLMNRYYARFSSSPQHFYRFPIRYLEYMDDYYNFEFRGTDIIVMGFPKSGTTWMQEILWTMLFNPDLTNEVAVDVPLYLRAPFLEEDSLQLHYYTGTASVNPFIEYFKKHCPDGDPRKGMFLQLINSKNDPRILKTHVPFSLFKKDMLDNVKVIYTCRDPKSLLPSYYNFARILKVASYGGSIDDAVNDFVNDKVMYSCYWNHVKEAWEKRNHPNFHFALYQDFVDDTKTEIQRLSKFLNVELTANQMDNVAKWCDFAQMKRRAVENNQDFLESAGLYHDIPNDAGAKGKFFRKGTGTDWKEHLTEKHIDQINKWTVKNTEGFGPDFPLLQKNL